MNRRKFLRRLSMSTAAFASASLLMQCSRSSSKPNILFIFADDQCHEALSAFGSQVQTPNLDRLVKNGVTFTNAYNMGAWHGAVCVASRTMLNTGRFLWEAKAIEPHLEVEREAGKLWAQYLASAGYDTYFSGKWHVKVDVAKVFQETRHVRPGMANQTPQGYNRPIEGKPDPWKPWDKKFGGYWKGGKHWSEVLGDDGVDYLAQAKGRENPFFMYLAFNAPHDPRQSPRRYVEKYPEKQIKVPRNFLPEYPYKDAIGCGKDLRDERLAPFPRTKYAIRVHRQEYYAIITHMDDQIGRILDALEKSGKKENTYIFFTADHGLAVGHHGLMGKQNMFEDSMRPPLIVVGPGIPENKRIDAPVYLQDIMPTTLELAGVKIPSQVEFKSLLPLIRGKKKENYEAIYGAYKNLQRMVRKGDFKLIYYPKIEKYLLFNLKTDPDEMVDLADKKEYRDKVDELENELRRLQVQVEDELVIH